MQVISAALRARGRQALRVFSGAMVLAALGTGVAQAQIGSERYASFVLDARSGTPLVAASADETRYPASLTKMMTIYMAFEAIRDRRTSFGTPIGVSEDAASMPPSKLGLVAGSSITVEEAILAMVTKSANDAAAALGEYLGGGSEARFSQMMTMKARQLGMRNTSFRNASGLPSFDQVTTARDMATLGRRLVTDFPQWFSYFSTPAFVFNGRTHVNHNRLLTQYDGADGIKTGYINDSGFNLVASARRDGVRLVAAVFGGSSSRERDQHMMAILDQGFTTMGVAPRGPSMAEREFTPYGQWAARSDGGEGRAERLRAAREARAERARELREARAERTREVREAKAERAAPVLRGHVYAAATLPQARTQALPPPSPFLRAAPSLFAAQAAPSRSASNLYQPVPLPPPVRLGTAKDPAPRGAPMQLAMAVPGRGAKVEPLRLATLPKPARIEQGDAGLREPKGKAVKVVAAPAPVKPKK